MSRRVFFAAVATAAIPFSAAFAEAFTTRIETRPFYGATVTLEEGVRVIRPLPPERQVIINPDGQTPLSLGFNETKVYQRSDVYNYSSDEGGVAPRFYGYGGWGGRGFRNKGGDHRQFAPGIGIGGGMGGGGGHGHQGSHR